MYSAFQLACKFIRYFITASNGKGHGVHSPFVFNFITKILTDKAPKEAYEKIEAIRKHLYVDDRVLTIEDLGAGSSIAKSNERKVREIARSSLKATKFAQLLHRVVAYYQPKTIIELGTSLGVTSAYLATGNNEAKVYTFEGAASIAAVARTIFSELHLQQVRLVEGNFDQTLPKILPNIQTIDLAFIDGNHRKEPTLHYFNQLLQKSNEQTIIIFDDIHWSREMEEAWDEIKRHPAVTLTIDLFFIGFVFFRKEQKVPQHFTVRF